MDHYTSLPVDMTNPGLDAFAIVPDDSTTLPNVTRAIYIGSAGNLSCVTMAGTTVTVQNLGAGTVLSLRVLQVRATGTTARGLLGII
jgi:hypothetical protein